MKGKLLFLAGAGAGFVLGSRQGRAPYEKLQAWWQERSGGMDGMDGMSGMGEMGGRRDLFQGVDATATDAFGEGLLIVETQRSAAGQPDSVRVAGASDSDLSSDLPSRMRYR